MTLILTQAQIPFETALNFDTIDAMEWCEVFLEMEKKKYA